MHIPESNGLRILMFDAFYDVEEKMKKGNPVAKKVPILRPLFCSIFKFVV